MSVLGWRRMVLGGTSLVAMACGSTAKEGNTARESAPVCDLRHLRDVGFQQSVRRGSFTSQDATACNVACSKNDLASCVGRAIIDERGNIAGRDPLGALVKYERLCQRGVVTACAHVGIAALMGQGTLPDLQRGIALLESSCAAHDAWACRQLGTDYGDGIGLEKDEEKAFHYLTLACKEDETHECGALGAYLTKKESSHRDVVRGTELLQRACQADNGRACVILGLLHRNGAQDFHNDEQRIRPLLERGCALGQIEGCYELGLELRDGQHGTPDVATGWDLIMRACVGGWDEACTQTRDNPDVTIPLLEKKVAAQSREYRGLLGFVYGFASNAQYQNNEKAANTLREACDDRDMNACRLLGDMHFDSSYSQRDEVLGKQYLEKACAAGEPMACNQVAFPREITEEGVRKSTIRDIQWVERGCRLGGPTSCELLGQSYMVRNEGEVAVIQDLLRSACYRGKPSACNALGLFVLQTQPNAEGHRIVKSLTQRGCLAGDIHSCTNAAVIEIMAENANWILIKDFAQRSCAEDRPSECAPLGLANLGGPERNVPEAMKLLEKACAAKDSNGCEWLGHAFRGGVEGVTQDLPKSVEYTKKACNTGSGTACRAVGRMYLHGFGVHADADVAIDFFTKSCDLNSDAGCIELGKACWGKPNRCLSKNKPVTAEQLLDPLCTKGLSWACEVLGDGYSRDGNAAAGDAYRRGCFAAQNGATSCRKWGEWSSKDNQPFVAAAAIERALDGGDAEASTSAWELHQKGWLAPRMIAMKLVEACDKNNLTACHVRATMLLRQAEQMGGDEKEAVTLFEKACAGDVFGACMRLGQAHWCGFGGLNRNSTEAVKHWTHACAGNPISGPKGAAAIADPDASKGDERACKMLAARKEPGVNLCVR